MSSKAPVLCFCEDCIQTTTVHYGETVWGKHVSYSTRQEHEKRKLPRSNTGSGSSSQPAPPPRPSEFSVDFSSVERLCCILVIWLHVKAGVSRSTATVVLKAIQFILTVLLGLIQTALTAQLGREIKLPEIQLPRTVETVFNKYVQRLSPHKL
ncbi:hypothetical protein B0H12DRAFT_1246357 [Mycena haematopus]|nr:hypothetical protein B0H12DRAFT_1246357 [Mycena haematopus]